MKKALVLMILGLFLVASIGFILADNENETGQDVQTQNQENNSGDDTQLQNQITTMNAAQIQKIKQVKNRVQAYLNSTECPEDCTCAGSTVKCWLNGQREMTVVAGNSGNIIVQVKGENASTNVTLYKSEGKLYGDFGNETKRIHDPEQVREKVNARIQAKTEGYNITLDENGYYQVQTKKRARLFLIVPVKERVKAQVNAETGEVVRVRNSWWGFLARDTREGELLGASCGTVSPDSVDQCCVNKGYDVWDADAGECVFSE